MNPYEVLGVAPSATPEEMKKAYKQAAGKLHPDKPTGDHEKFTALQRAYSIVSDPDRRARYDSTGESEKSPGPNPREVIAQVFAQVAENSDTEHQDIAQLVRRHFQGQRKTLSISALAKQSKKWGQIRRRTKSELYISVAKSRREQIAKQYLQVRMTRKLIDLCLEIMSDWDYKYDPPPPQSQYDPFMSPFFTRSTYAR